MCIISTICLTLSDSIFYEYAKSDSQFDRRVYADSLKRQLTKSKFEMIFHIIASLIKLLSYHLNFFLLLFQGVLRLSK